MRFSQDFIEKVRDANNLAEVISQYTELRRNGDRMMGRCPFPDHAEKTPSFSVSESKQLYHCFGCKKSGNVFTFLETFNGMSFREAVEFLAKRASIPIPVDESGKSDKNRDAREHLLQINRWAGYYYHQQLSRLPKDHPALRYIEKRGLTAEIIEKFKIGVSLETWEGLVTFLVQKKIPLPFAESLGLVKRKKESRGGSGFFDLFRERILFPIFSPSDELLGFGGRTYGDATPKYLNSPETPVFHKGRVLYGLHETGKFIRSEDHAVVVEGYMDAIALYAAGIKNVVAILGTAFTPDHAKLLKRYTSNITMLLDGDNAGMNAAERSLPILLEAGLLVKGSFLPDGLDPDDFIRQHGVDVLREELAKAPELFNLVLGRWMREYRGSASEKVKLVADLYPVLKPMENKQLRELYVSEVAQRLDVEPQWLNRAMAAEAQKERDKTAKAPAPAAGVNRPMVRATQSNGPQFGEGKASQSPMGNPSMNAQIASMGVEAEVGAAESAPPEVPRKLISMKGAPRDEAFVLSLTLQSETLLQEARESRLVEMLGHSGVRQALAWTLEKYGQKPQEFDKLAASLASQIDTPSILTCSLDVIRRPGPKTDGPEQEGNPDDTEERLMTDYVNAIRKRYLRDQAKALANQLRDQSNPEMLEQFMNIQKVRHSLDRE